MFRILNREKNFSFGDYAPFFLVLSHWADREKVWFFLNLIFMSEIILCLNAIHSVIRQALLQVPKHMRQN
jgi:hypothetical protein